MDMKQKLMRTASDMRALSYAPYSHFTVGAALLGKNGKIYTGCNVENAGYGPTICAERTAFAKAVSEGCREFLMIAIAGGREEEECAGPCAPCGVCRQVMREFCDPDSFLILMGKDGEILAERTLSELLPMSFGPDDLKGRNIL